MSYRKQLNDMMFDASLKDLSDQEMSELASQVEQVGEDADKLINQMREVLDGLVRDMKQIKPSSHVGVQMAEKVLEKANSKVDK